MYWKCFYVKDKLLIPYNEYHAGWRPGDSKSQGISSHGVEQVLPQYFGVSTGGADGMCEWVSD